MTKKVEVALCHSSRLSWAFHSSGRGGLLDYDFRITFARPLTAPPTH